MVSIKLHKLYDDVELPTGITTLDLQIHSFHKIDEYEGIIPHPTQTFLLQGGHRVIAKMGYYIELCSEYPHIKYPDYQFQIISRTFAANKDGLIVLNAPCYYSGLERKEVEIILYNSSFDRVVLLKKGYRIAQAILVPKCNFDIIP